MINFCFVILLNDLFWFPFTGRKDIFDFDIRIITHAHSFEVSYISVSLYCIYL